MEGERINYNYIGSIAQRKMHFSSSVDAVVDEKNELFNAVSIYVPMSLASDNVVDFDPAWVSAEKPAVFTCILDNYKTVMKGKLLDQWMDAFRQDTNTSLILYVIVFLDDESTAGLWEIDDVSIKFAPLTSAFNKLFFISYVKVLFDETYDGRPAILPANPGTPASMVIRFANTASSAVTVSTGVYAWTDGVQNWVYTVDTAITLPPGEYVDVELFAATPGVDANLPDGSSDNPFTNIASLFDPALPEGITVVGQSSIQGTDPSAGPLEVPSSYFDLSLALAYLCKLNLDLSYFISLVKVSYLDQKPNPADSCWIRRATSAEEKEAMQSIMDGDRTKYYWGALFLMNCVQNTWVLVHSEPVNIVPLIFAAWFAERNASGQFIGNKLSLLRLGGTRIKPLGFPSWLNSEVNENDAEGFDLLDTKNAGYLCTIADNTPQESCVSSARAIGGVPVAAQMIAKWVDYTSAQQCAKLITASGTLADPVLTDEQAYRKIQEIFSGNLLLFVPIKRINNVVMKFPPFATAKKGLTKIEAASSWQAGYTDDLDEVTVTGGITAE
jgi:hypothetical protein